MREPQGAGKVSWAANALGIERDRRQTMKSIIALWWVALCITTMTGPADAKGCLNGAIVGGAAGHFAGHHGLIGAAAGCLIGRHEARKHELEQTDGDRNSPAYH
jgi:hypothetical protein